VTKPPAIISWLRRCLTGDLSYEGQEFVALFRDDAEQLLAWLEDPGNSCWECSGSNCELQGLCDFHAHQKLQELGNAIAVLQAIKIEDDRKKHSLIDQLSEQKQEVKYLEIENRALHRFRDELRALRDHPMKLTYEELATHLSQENRILQQRIAGLKIQVKRWAARVKRSVTLSNP